MELQEQIDEIFLFLKEDCTNYGIVGTIHYGDIDPNVFERQEVKGFSFDHIFFTQKCNPAMEDYYTGVSLIPIGNYVYARCEWNS